MKRINGKMSMFVVLAVLIAGMILTVITVPQMLIGAWKYMWIDFGYKWVVNLTVGVIVGAVVYGICTKSNRNNIVAILIAVVTGLIMVVICEWGIWHRKEFGELFTSRMTIQMIGYIAIGIGAAIVSYWLVERNTEKKGDPQPTPERKPEEVEEGGATRRGSNRRNDPTK